MKKFNLYALMLTTASATWASAQAPVAPAAAPGPVPVASPCPCPKAFQGFFIGGNIGYGLGRANTTFNTNPAVPPAPSTAVPIKNNLSLAGVDGGLNVGYTHRFGNFGLGVEGVFTWSNTKGNQTQNWTNMPGPFGPVTILDQLSLQNSIQLRANFSYVICNLIAPKIILGWDNSSWKRMNTYIGFPISGQEKRRFNSFLFGAGIDFLITQHVIAGLEYTGTVTGAKTRSPFLDTQQNITTWSTKPQYNKFALTIKFIY